MYSMTALQRNNFVADTSYKKAIYLRCEDWLLLPALSIEVSTMAGAALLAESPSDMVSGNFITALPCRSKIGVVNWILSFHVSSRESVLL